MTPLDLIEAANLGARIETRTRVALGEDGRTIRRAIVDRFRSEIASESYGESSGETLMVAVREGIEAVLGETADDHPSPRFRPRR